MENKKSIPKTFLIFISCLAAGILALMILLRMVDKWDYFKFVANSIGILSFLFGTQVSKKAEGLNKTISILFALWGISVIVCVDKMYMTQFWTTMFSLSEETVQIAFNSLPIIAIMLISFVRLFGRKDKEPEQSLLSGKEFQNEMMIINPVSPEVYAETSDDQTVKNEERQKTTSLSLPSNMTPNNKKSSEDFVQGMKDSFVSGYIRIFNFVIICMLLLLMVYLIQSSGILTAFSIPYSHGIDDVLDFFFLMITVVLCMGLLLSTIITMFQYAEKLRKEGKNGASLKPIIEILIVIFVYYNFKELDFEDLFDLQSFAITSPFLSQLLSITAMMILLLVVFFIVDKSLNSLVNPDGELRKNAIDIAKKLFTLVCKLLNSIIRVTEMISFYPEALIDCVLGINDLNDIEEIDCYYDQQLNQE